MIGKKKVAYAIEAFILFLNMAQGADFTPLREEAVILSQKLIGDDLNAASATHELNLLIENLNRVLKTPYPALMTDTDENLVKTEIVAFEHYLNQGLKANHLTVHQEAPLFQDSMRLWERIGVSLTAKEGLFQFAALVEKVNHFLPENERYPVPDTTL